MVLSNRHRVYEAQRGAHSLTSRSTSASATIARSGSFDGDSTSAYDPCFSSASSSGAPVLKAASDPFAASMEEKGDSMQRRLLSRLLKLAALSGTLFVGVRTCGSLFGGRSALVATINVSKEGAVAQQNPAGIVAGSARSNTAAALAANAKKGSDGGGKKANPPNMHSAAPADAVPPRPRNTRPRSSTTTVTQAKTTTYANGKRFPRRWLQSFSEQELSKSQQVADSLVEEVRDEMSFCWENYKKQAWGYDEVHPLRGGGRNTMGGIAVTILDSLDTLFLMDMKDEFFEAVDWIIGRNTTLSSRLAGSKVKTSSNHKRNAATTQAGGPESERHVNGLDFSRAGKASVFEIVIRGLGGLLGAYTMLTDGGNADFVSSTTSPGEHDHGLTASRAALLLEKATDLGSRLLRAFTHSKSVFPLKEVQIGDVTRGWRTERATNIAEVGSLQLEFRALANFTNDFAQFKVLPDKSVTALIDIAEAHERRGLIPLEVTESSGDEQDEAVLRELFGLPANHALGGGRAGRNTNEAVVSSIEDPSSERARAELLATQSERQYENHAHVRGSHLSLGAGSDSFYEYLLKQFLQSGRVDLRYRDQFVKAMNEMIDTLVLKTPNYGQTFVGDATNQGRVWKMEHLTCYVPGLLVLALMQIVGSSAAEEEEEIVAAAGTSESMKTAAQRVREAENAVKEKWLNTAKGVAETCYNMYAVSPTGLSPEFVWMNRVADEDGTVFSAAAHPSEQWYSSGTSEPFVAGGADAGEPSSWSAVVLSTLGWSSAARPAASRGGSDQDAPGGSSRKTDIVIPNDDAGKYNLLRPETVESLYYLHYYTGDPKYREWGRNIFRSFQRYAKAGYGFASLDDVRKAGEAQDRQESFWMAETLKYLFLLFSPRETFDLSRFVFTTEGHVLKLPEK